MLLNRVEKALMNNPVRAGLQRRYEAPKLLRMGGPVRGRALELGCGRGVGLELVLGLFGAERVDAFDLDPDMVRRARYRAAGFGDRVRLWCGDATCLAVPEATYDAVFDFGVIHHVPRWRDAVREAFRVLRPGGKFYAEEVLARFILHPLWRRVLDHPLEDRFDAPTFERALVEVGFREVVSDELWGEFAWFVARRP